jgi:hypothetical protein
MIVVFSNVKREYFYHTLPYPLGKPGLL